MPNAAQRPFTPQTLAGVAWSGVGHYGAAGIRLLAVALLAWRLPPSDFGLLALVMAFLLFSEGFSELGLVGALIQREQPDEPALSTAFWMNTGASCLIAGASAWLAGPITILLGDAAAAPLLRVLCLILPIAGLSAVPRALLSRELAFRRVSTIQLIGEVGFGTIGLVMAVNGLGVWSLAGAVLAQRLLGTVLYWRSVTWRPKLAYSRESQESLLAFGGTFMLGAILNRGMGNLDYFIVGRWLGIEALGFYSLAFQLSATPINRLVGVLQRVAFPVLSRMQDELPRMRETFTAGLQYLFSATLPCSLFAAVLGPWFIAAAYGAKWAPSQAPLQILAAGSFFCTLDLAHSAYFALGNPRLRLWLVVLRISFFAATAGSLGLNWGIQGVAVCLAAAFLVSGLAGLAVAARSLGFGASDAAQALWPSLKAAMLASAPAFGLAFLPDDALGPWQVLIILGALMSLLYALGIWPLYRKLRISPIQDWPK